MSLKFAVVGSLLGTLGTRARAENQAQNLEPVEPHDDPLLTIFGRRISTAAPKKPCKRFAADLAISALSPKSGHAQSRH
jgi:hypothetical protein